MVDERLAEKLRQACPDDRLPCGLAFKIAKELNVPVMQVGNAANELGIKIVECQLGCFGWRKK